MSKSANSTCDSIIVAILIPVCPAPAPSSMMRNSIDMVEACSTCFKLSIEDYTILDQYRILVYFWFLCNFASKYYYHHCIGHRNGLVCLERMRRD